MHDLVIRNGKVADGSGRPVRRADVAIEGERIVGVAEGVGRGREEIDAAGALVTPGWVDIHTHYDGQVTWDPYLTPSGWNGVTTAVMGNCGVGFAPVRPGREDYLIQLMEGVEDIPGSALAEGIAWGWESFPEYLDALEKMPRALDVGTQVPHGAVRAYVMGERGAHNDEATPQDIAAMAEVVFEGLEAGALGFSTSRTVLHRAKDGELVPGTSASTDELLGIGAALARAGHGVVEVASDMFPEERELGWMRDLSRQTGRTVTFGLLQNDIEPTKWRRLLEATEELAAQGCDIRPQIAARPAGMLFGLESSLHPFVVHRGYRAIAEKPLAERLAAMRTPEVRRSILGDPPAKLPPILLSMAANFERMYPLGDPPDYEPGPEKSIAAIARKSGRTNEEVAYDQLLEEDGRALIYRPFLGYSDGNFDVLRELMVHPRTVFGLSDGGAHCGLICDASVPTFLLTHWARDRVRGERIPVEFLVHAQTRRTAELFGLHDRGLLAPGMLADLNVIDEDRLRIHRPRMARDLPAGGRRLLQDVEGYRTTVKRGVPTYCDGEPTGRLPGRLIRGPQTT